MSALPREVPLPDEPPDRRSPSPPEPGHLPSADQLAAQLLDRRIVRVSGVLDLPTATEACARLMLLDGTGDDPIEVVMSCPDGELLAATALADTIELVGVELRAVAAGSVGGPALLPFALATRRVAQPHALFKLSDPRFELTGRATDLVREAECETAMLQVLHQRIAVAAGRDVDELAADFHRGRLLTAVEAKEYGLVDEIAQAHRPAQV